MLKVYIDFKEPAAYLALAPTLALAERLDVPLTWRAFRSQDRDLPDSGSSPAIVLSHQRARARALRSMHRHYAALQGIDLRFPETQYGTDLALGALAQLSGNALPFVREAFESYWAGHLDLNDRDVVERLLESSGVAAEVDLDEADVTLAAAQAEAEEAGVVDAPAYVIDGQLFIGRQHFPWIEEIIAGLRARV